MNFWSFIGLTNTKQFDEVSQKLSDMTAKLESITEQHKEISSAICIFDKQINEKFEKTILKINETEAFANDSLKLLVTNYDIKAKSDLENYECIKEKLNDILKSISETSENMISVNHTEIKEHSDDIIERITTIISNIDEKSKRNDEKLKNIEIVSSKLLEAVKIIWIDSMIENLNVVKTI